MSLDTTAKNLELALDRLGLRFIDVDTERGFRSWHIEQGLPMTRIGMSASVINWLAALSSLYLVDGHHRHWFALWVLGVQIPAILATLWLSYRPRAWPWLPLLTASTNAMAGLTCVVACFWSLERPEISMAAVVLVSQFAFTIFPLRVPFALAAVLSFLCVHEVLLAMAVSSGELSTSSAWFLSLAPLLGMLSGLLANVIVERANRARYRQTLIIETQRKTIDRERARADVAERSRELSEALTKLTEAGPQRLSPGDLIEDKFRIVRALGRGGMGEVHEVEQLADGKHLALKVLSGKIDRDSLLRFAREAKIAAAIDHPNVVDVVEVGVAPAGMYLAMELVAGSTLAHAKDRYGDVAWALPILQQVAAALAAMHGRGVVHRDLKPANVLLDGNVPKLTDFGIATLGEPKTGPIDAHGDTMATGGDLGLTQTGAILGTPLYMAPELSMGSRDPKPAVDIWAFGVMAYELLTGSLPFAEAPVLARLAGRIASPPRALEIEIDDTLKTIIARCLAADHEARPTAGDLVAAFASATPGS